MTSSEVRERLAKIVELAPGLLDHRRSRWTWQTIYDLRARGVTAEELLTIPRRYWRGITGLLGIEPVDKPRESAREEVEVDGGN